MKSQLKSKILLALLAGCTALLAQGQYNPTKHTVTNKPYGMSQAGPTDARSYWYDSALFRYRPFQDTSEVNDYLNQARYRTGQFSIVVHSGGTLNLDDSYTGGVNEEWWYKDGTADSNLVRKIPGGDVGIIFNDGNGFNGTVTSPNTLSLTTQLTSGSVPFIGTGGALRENNAKLHWDSTNARLGIGTAAPTVKLNVYGQSIFDNNYSLSGVAANDRMMQINDTVTSDNGTADRFPRALFAQIVTAGGVNFNGPTEEVIGIQGQVKFNANVTTREGVGVIGRAWGLATNTAGRLVGVEGQITVSTGAIQTAQQATGIEATLYHQGGTLTATNLYYLRTRDTNQLLEPMTLNVDTAYGVYIHNVAAGDVNYAIYQKGTTPRVVFEAEDIETPSLPEYADNAAAITGGLGVGRWYRTGDGLKVVH